MKSSGMVTFWLAMLLIPGSTIMAQERLPEKAVLIIYNNAPDPPPPSATQMMALESPDTETRVEARQRTYEIVQQAFREQVQQSSPALAAALATADTAPGSEGVLELPWFSAQEVRGPAGVINQIAANLRSTPEAQTGDVTVLTFDQQQFIGEVPVLANQAASVGGANDILRSVDSGVARIQADKVWAYSRGKGVRVAVIDSGIDINHPIFISSNIEYESKYNLIDSSFPPADDRTFTSQGRQIPGGHGSHVAGIIAGQHGYGVAPDAVILPIKVFENTKGLTPDIFRAIDVAIKNGADVINMSLAGPDAVIQGQSILSLYNRKIQEAAERNIVVVAASGNFPNNIRLNDIGVPGGCPGVITVSAVRKNDSPAAGTLPLGRSGVKTPDIGAPGGNWNDQAGRGEGIPSANAYGRGTNAIILMPGSSMATPHVSGVVALIKGKRKDLTPDQIKAAIRNTAAAVNGDPGGLRTGAGRIDALAAYEKAVGVIDGGGGKPPVTDEEIKTLREILAFWKEKNGGAAAAETPNQEVPREPEDKSLSILTQILNEQRIFNIQMQLEPAEKRLEEAKQKFAEIDEAEYALEDEVAAAVSALETGEANLQTAIEALEKAAAEGKIDDVKAQTAVIKDSRKAIKDAEQTRIEKSKQQTELEKEKVKRDNAVKGAKAAVDRLKSQLDAATKLNP
jgi:subtilisin family serine protease